MQVILTEDIDNLGRTGELVTIRDGYGRNYLIPRGLAVMATPRNMRHLEHERRIIEQRDSKRRKDAQSIKEKLEGLSLTISANVGEDERLFGSVTNRDIAEALAAEGVTIDRKDIPLDQPIKSLGVYTVPIRLTRDISAELKVWVVAK